MLGLALAARVLNDFDVFTQPFDFWKMLYTSLVNN
jgi:hypothetical protein